MDKKRRKAIESKVLEVFNTLDKSGKNGEKQAAIFKGMTDAQFDSWYTGFMADPDAHFYIEVTPYDNEPTLKDIKAAAKVINVPLEEYVYYPHEAVDGKPVRSAKKVPVGYLHLKRLQQVLSKKNAFGFDASTRNPITGQVTSDSKIARNSDAETYALTLMNADSTLRELNGPRADNAKARSEMYRQISVDGYARLRDLPNDTSQKQVLNLVDVYLLSAGLESDLITDGNVFLSTLQKNS